VLKVSVVTVNLNQNRNRGVLVP